MRDCSDGMPSTVVSSWGGSDVGNGLRDERGSELSGFCCLHNEYPYYSFFIDFALAKDTKARPSRVTCVFDDRSRTAWGCIVGRQLLPLYREMCKCRCALKQNSMARWPGIKADYSKRRLSGFHLLCAVVPDRYPLPYTAQSFSHDHFLIYAHVQQWL
jgi:hypothetical protein